MMEDDECKRCFRTIILMIDMVHKQVKEIEEQLETKNDHNKEGSNVLGMLNLLYTDMHTFCKFLEDVLPQHADLERIQRWCSLLKNVLWSMEIDKLEGPRV